MLSGPAAFSWLRLDSSLKTPLSPIEISGMVGWGRIPVVMRCLYHTQRKPSRTGGSRCLLSSCYHWTWECTSWEMMILPMCRFSFFISRQMLLGDMNLPHCPWILSFSTACACYHSSGDNNSNRKQHSLGSLGSQQLRRRFDMLYLATTYFGKFWQLWIIYLLYWASDVAVRLPKQYLYQQHVNESPTYSNYLSFCCKMCLIF